MNLRQLVLKALKPKVSAYGFNKKELQGVAAVIADNLSYADDASEEDIQTAINDKIAEVLPLLKLGQSQANRIVNERRASEEEEEDEEEGGSKPANTTPTPKKPKPVDESKPKDEPKPKDEQPEWAKALIETVTKLGVTVSDLSSDLGTIKAKETAQGRTAKMQELLKDAGVYGTSILSMFPRLSFKDDDEFNTYYEDTKTNLEAFNNEQKEKGIEITPPAGSEKPKETLELTDEQLGDIAAMF